MQMVGPGAPGVSGRLGITFDAGDLSIPLANPPLAYAESLDVIAPGINSLVADNRSGDESWYEALLRLLPAVVATDQQRKLLSVQVERARQGLPPLDTSSYGLGVKVGISDDAKTMVMWAGLGLLGLFGLHLLTRR